MRKHFRAVFKVYNQTWKLLNLPPPWKNRKRFYRLSHSDLRRAVFRPYQPNEAETHRRKNEILRGNAQNTAADFLSTTQNKLAHVQDTAGNLPTYNFTGNSGALRISVTKAGGYISTMENSREVTSENLTFEDASKKPGHFSAAGRS